MSFRPSAFAFSRTADPGGNSLLSDMFSPTIPESLPSYPSSGRRSGRFSFPSSGGGGNKMQHLPPPPSPGMGGHAELPGYAGRGGSNNTSYEGSWRPGDSYRCGVDIPSSPAAHLYWTPPTSRKKFRGFSGEAGVRREGRRVSEEEEDERFGFNTYSGSGSPPPLSTFYDGPLDGSLGLSSEEDREEDEERYDSISSYRRDAGFKDSGVELGLSNSGGLRGGALGGGSLGSSSLGSLGSTSRKRTWASTLDEDEWYENGRGGLVRGGGGGVGAAGANVAGANGAQGGQEERGQGGGGKRRIIDVVGSVASRLWEVVKGNATWGFYYPVSIVRGVGSTSGGAGAGASGIVGEGEKQQQQQQEEEAVRRISAESSRGVLGGSNLPQVQPYSYTSGPMADHTSSPTSQSQRPSSSSSSSRRRTLTAPDSPTKSRRRANTSFTSARNKKSLKPAPAGTAETAENSSMGDLDTESGLRASWVLVPQQEFTPTAASLPSSSRLRTAVTHSRSASSTTHVPAKKRPFRHPVHIKPTSANVSFDFPAGSGGPGRRGRKKSLSWGGAGGWGEEEKLFGMGTGVTGAEGEEDEVDESMRRWNERLREMIKEGREALGSKVEVVYED